MKPQLKVYSGEKRWSFSYMKNDNSTGNNEVYLGQCTSKMIEAISGAKHSIRIAHLIFEWNPFLRLSRSAWRMEM